MKKLPFVALSVSLMTVLASCGGAGDAPVSVKASIREQAAAYEVQPKPLAAALGAQSLTKTVGLTGISSRAAECANLYATVVASTPSDPLAAYYGMTVRSTASGSGYASVVKTISFPIDSAHDWNVTLECRDPRFPDNHSASSFQLWRAANGDAAFAQAPTRYVISRSSEQAFWAGYGATREVQTFQGSFSPTAAYGEINRPRAGSN